MWWWRKASLIALFTRFRSTAFDSVRLPTIIPSLAFVSLLRTKYILQNLSAIAPECKTWLKPVLRNNLCALEKLLNLLYRESCTAFCAASINNGAASACFHAHQKTVCAFSFRY
jgi:hypothetical protein